MKYKLIEKVPIPIPRHKNKKDIGEKIIVKAQTEKEYLILDLFRYKRYISRYVLNTETGEHAGRYEQGDWNTQKLIRIMGYDPLYESFYNSRILEKVRWDTKEDIETVKMPYRPYIRINIFCLRSKAWKRITVKKSVSAVSITNTGRLTGLWKGSQITMKNLKSGFIKSAAQKDISSGTKETTLMDAVTAALRYWKRIWINPDREKPENARNVDSQQW